MKAKATNESYVQLYFSTESASVAKESGIMIYGFTQWPHGHVQPPTSVASEKLPLLRLFILVSAVSPFFTTI